MQNGDTYRKRSENNILKKATIFTERGIIYDRNGRELAWNKKSEESRLKLFAENGSEISFIRGQIWFEILPIGNKVTY